MKKFLYLIILCASLFIGNEANAQMCQITGNVEPTLKEQDNNTLKVELKNYNSYMVTVQVYVEVAGTDGTIKEHSRTVVLKAEETKTITGFGIQNSNVADVDKNSSSVRIVVQKCS